MHAAATALALCVTHAAIAQPCSPTWDDRFRYSDLNSPLNCSVVYDDGSGPAFYLGGTVRPDGTSVGFSKWDGQRLVPIAPGVDGVIARMIVWDDDGPGPRRPAIFATGWFRLENEPYRRPRLMRWDGQWSVIPGVFDGYASFNAMAVHHDGTRERIYVGGQFTGLDGAPISNLAAFDGQAWSNVGGGVSSTSNQGAWVNALASFTDASGPALYVGGSFNRTGAFAATSMGKFRNDQWVYTPGVFISVLPSSVFPGTVTSIAVADPLRNGTPTLVIAGSFYRVDNSTVAGLAMLNALGHWVPVGPLPEIRTSVGRVFSADLGQGRSLFAVSDERGLERFDGQQWLSVAPDLSGVGNWTVLDAGAPSSVCVTQLSYAGTTALPGAGIFGGSTWTPLGGFGLGFNSSVYKLIKGDLGQGEELFALGGFTHAGSTYVNGSARWTGSSWAPLGFGIADEEQISDAIIFDDGSGPHLYEATVRNGIMRLAEGVWTSIGQLYQTPLYSPTATRLVIYDADESGPQPASLYAAGRFTTEDLSAWSPLARLTNGSWELLPAPPGWFDVYEVHDACVATSAMTGSAPAIIISGRFTQEASYSLLRWNGSQWSRDAVEFPLVTSGASRMVMAAHDDGDGEALYVAGSFAGSPAIRLRDGQWSPYGGSSTITSWFDPLIELRSLQLPEGRALMLLGGIDGLSAPAILRAEAIEPFPFHAYFPYTAVDYNDGSGPALFIGGSLFYTTTPDGGYLTDSAGLAVLHFCRPTCTADFNADGDTGTDQDIEAFFACLGGHCCSRCGSADFNDDGDTGTDQDIEAFFRVLGGGSC